MLFNSILPCAGDYLLSFYFLLWDGHSDGLIVFRNSPLDWSRRRNAVLRPRRVIWSCWPVVRRTGWTRPERRPVRRNKLCIAGTGSFFGTWFFLCWTGNVCRTDLDPSPCLGRASDAHLINVIPPFYYIDSSFKELSCPRDQFKRSEAIQMISVLCLTCRLPYSGSYKLHYQRLQDIL